MTDDYLNIIGISFDKNIFILVTMREHFNGKMVVQETVEHFELLNEVIKFIQKTDPLARVVVDEPQNITSDTIKRIRLIFPYPVLHSSGVYIKIYEPYLTKRIFLDSPCQENELMPNLKSELLYKFQQLLERNILILPEKFLNQIPKVKFDNDEFGNMKPYYSPGTIFQPEFRAILATLSHFPFDRATNLERRWVLDLYASKGVRERPSLESVRNLVTQ